jgi:uncharacterized protein YcnI
VNAGDFSKELHHMKRVITILGVAATVAFATAASASAHVTANPADQKAGGFAKLEFRVPDERDVQVTKVDIQIPEGVDDVSVQPVTGWTYQVKKSKLDTPIKMDDGDTVTDRVSEVVFMGSIKPGEFQSFYVSMKLPEQGEVGDYLFFPTLQTYEGGEVVSWIEKPAKGKDPFSLEKPAPFVTLAAAGSSGDSAAASTKSSSSDSKDDEGDDDLTTADKSALGLSIAALAIALLAFLRGDHRRARKD